jgi:hypothetical protein
VAAAVPGDAFAETVPGTRYALICTVERYFTTSLKLLGHADHDGHALAEVLTHSGWQVTFLHTDPGRATATLGQLRSSMTDVGRRCQPEDTLLFVFVGQGLQPGGARSQCLALRNTEADDPATALPLQELYKWMSDCRAGTKLLLLDACRPKPTRRVLIPPLDNPQVPPAGIAALTSCSPGEFGYESDVDKHGLFLKCVIDGLRGSAMEADRTVTWSGLRDFVTREVPRAAERLPHGGLQSPRELSPLRGPSPVLLSVPAPTSVAKPAPELAGEISRPPAGVRTTPGPESKPAHNGLPSAAGTTERETVRVGTLLDDPDQRRVGTLLCASLAGLTLIGFVLVVLIVAWSRKCSIGRAFLDVTGLAASVTWQILCVLVGVVAVCGIVLLALLSAGGGSAGPRTGNLRTCSRCGAVVDRSVAFMRCPNCGWMI